MQQLHCGDGTSAELQSMFCFSCLHVGARTFRSLLKGMPVRVVK